MRIISKKKHPDFVRNPTDRPYDAVIITDQKGYIRGEINSRIKFNDNIFKYIELQKDRRIVRKALFIATTQSIQEVEVLLKFPNSRVFCYCQITYEKDHHLYVYLVWLKLQLFQFPTIPKTQYQPTSYAKKSSTLSQGMMPGFQATCYFCDKTEHQATNLYSGPGVYICDDCLLKGRLEQFGKD